MIWLVVLEGMLQVMASLLEIVVATHEFQPRNAQHSPQTDSDDWKCPSAAEIARVVCRAPASDDRRSGGSIGERGK